MSGATLQSSSFFLLSSVLFAVHGSANDLRILPTELFWRSFSKSMTDCNQADARVVGIMQRVHTTFSEKAHTKS